MMKNTLFLFTIILLLHPMLPAKAQKEAEKMDDLVRAEEIKELKFGMLSAGHSLPSTVQSGRPHWIRMLPILQPLLVILTNGVRWQRMQV